MTTLKSTKTLVINTRHGGFGLSDAASREIARRKGIELRTEECRLFVGTGYERLSEVVERDDPHLVNVVREMGNAAWGESAILRIVEVEVNIEITDNDGMENISVHGGIVR